MHPTGEPTIEDAQPLRDSGRPGGQIAGHRRGRAVTRQEIEHRVSDPEDGPHRPGPAGWLHGGVAPRPSRGRPRRQSQHQIEQGGPRCAEQRGHMAAGHTTEPLTEVPDATGPDRRGDDGPSAEPGNDERHAQRQLGGRKEPVEEGGVEGDQVGVPVHGPGHEERLTGCRRSNDLTSESPGEHIRLELQGSVEEPQRPQRVLEGPTRDDGRSGGTVHLGDDGVSLECRGGGRHQILRSGLHSARRALDRKPPVAGRGSFDTLPTGIGRSAPERPIGSGNAMARPPPNRREHEPHGFLRTGPPPRMTVPSSIRRQRQSRLPYTVRRLPTECAVRSAARADPRGPTVSTGRVGLPAVQPEAPG